LLILQLTGQQLRLFFQTDYIPSTSEALQCKFNYYYCCCYYYWEKVGNNL